MNRFVEKLKEQCIAAGAFPDESFIEDESAFGRVNKPGWYTVDWYELTDENCEVYKIIDLVEYSGPCGLSAKIIARGRGMYLTDDVYQYNTECPSYLVRVSIPEEELALAYLTVEN